MPILLLATIPVAAAPVSEFAEQANRCFSELLDLRIRDGNLVVTCPAYAGGTRSASASILSAYFTGVGRFEFRTGRGSSSSSRGGSGRVAVEVERSGNPGAMTFHLLSPDGRETVDLVQTAPGALEFNYKGPAGRVRYTQSRGACRSYASMGDVAGSASGASFVELLQTSASVGTALLDALEMYFGRVPADRPSPVPSGAALVELPDGSAIIGTPSGEE
ncbi:MAG: hypothetical protein JXP34_24390, partial [Planctomycetes bacterium]|nr:hypothetical protein [Planctomycetota bacterium]